MLNASPAAQNLVASCNGAKVSIQQLETATQQVTLATKASHMAMKALSIALNMLAYTAIIKGAQLLTDTLHDLANAEKIASEKADELYNESSSKVQKNEEEVESLEELIQKYKELKKNEYLDLEGRQEVKEIQSDIADLVGIQAKNLDLVNGKLDEEIKKLNEISEKEAKQAFQDAEVNYHNAKDSANKAVGNDKVFFEDYDYAGDIEVDARKALEEAGFGVYNSNGHLTAPSWGGFGQDGVMGSQMVVKAIGDTAQEKYDYLQSMIEVLEQYGQRDSEIAIGLKEQAGKYEDYITNQQNAANSLVDSWITYSQFSNKALSKINVDSVESFETYRQKMIDEIQKDETVGQMMADGILSKDDLETAINDFMATSTKFSTWYEKWAKDMVHGSYYAVQRKAYAKFGADKYDDRGFAIGDTELDKFAKENSINTEEEVKFWDECIEESETRKEAMETYLNRSIDTFTFNVEKLDEYQSKISKLGEAYGKLLSGNYSKSDVLDILKTLSEQGVDISTVNSIDTLKGLIKYSTLATDDLDKLIKELGVEPDSDLAIFLQDMTYETLQVDSAFEGLSTKLNDLKSGYTTLKDAIDEYNESGKLTTKTFDALMNMDYENLFSVLNGGKIEIDKEGIRKELLDYIASVRNTLVQESTSHYGESGLESIEDYNTKNKLLNNFEEYVRGSDFSLDDIFGIGSSSSTENTFDWIEVKIDHIKDTIEELRDVADDPFASWTDKKSSLQKIIAQLEGSKDIYKQAHDAYMSEAGKLGLDQSYIDLITGKEGKFEIELFKDDSNYDKIKEYQDLYQQAQEMLNLQSDVNKEINDTNAELYENQDKQYQLNIAKLEAQKQSIQNIIDANGGRGTTEQYENLKSYEEQILAQKEEQLLQARLYLSELKVNTNEYLDQLEVVYDLENETAQIKNNIKDWDLEKINLILDDINDKMEELDECIEKNQNAIDSQDRFISGAIGILNQEIEAQEGLRDIIQDRIDALQEENDEHERALALEKAKYELERARSQRNVKLYSGEDRGFIYTQNEEDIRSAQEELDNLEFEETIHALEKQKEYYEDIIENLGEIQDRWNNIASKAQEMLDIEYTLGVGGEGVRGAILNNTYDIYSLEQSYKSFLTEGERLDNEKKRLEELDKAISKVVDRFETGLIDYDGCVEEITSIASKHTDLLSTIVSNVLGEVKLLEDTSSNSMGNVEADASDAIKDVTKATEEETEEQTTIFDGFADTVKKTYSEVVSDIIKDMDELFQGFADRLTLQASELKNTISGMLADIQKDMGGMEGIGATLQSSSTSPGKLPIETKATGGMLTGKDKKLDKLARSLGEDHITMLAYKEGERVLTPVQNEIWEKLNANAGSFTMNPLTLDSIIAPKYENIPTSNIMNSSQVTIGDIHLHEVQNVPDFAKALQKYLPNISVQYNGKH